MPFQSTVEFTSATGVIGDIFIDGPRRGQPGILRSSDPANNVIGRAFSHVAGDDLAVTADTPGAFAGILANSRTYALQGTAAGGTLAPTIVLPNETNVELVTLTSGIIVLLTTDAAIGENVFYSDTDGSIAADPSTTLAGHTLIPNAKIVRRNIPAPGLAIVELT